jgi:hypothetical protein
MLPQAVIAVLILATIRSAAATEYLPDRIPAKAKVFACVPDLLHSRDKLTIRMSVPHGTDLGIRTPKNDFFFVYSCDPAIRLPRWTDVDCGSFANLPRITIDLATFEVASGYPPFSQRRVFSEAGVYTILLAKNLETENTNRTVNRCKVQFHRYESKRP